MPEELWTALEAESQRTGVSISELVRQSVALHLAYLGVVRSSGDAPTLEAILDRLGRD